MEHLHVCIKHLQVRIIDKSGPNPLTNTVTGEAGYIKEKTDPLTLAKRSKIAAATSTRVEPTGQVVAPQDL